MLPKYFNIQRPYNEKNSNLIMKSVEFLSNKPCALHNSGHNWAKSTKDMVICGSKVFLSMELSVFDRGPFSNMPKELHGEHSSTSLAPIPASTIWPESYQKHAGFHAIPPLALNRVQTCRPKETQGEHPSTHPVPIPAIKIWPESHQKHARLATATQSLSQHRTVFKPLLMEKDR
jgi:hypothetical protein